MLIPHTGPDPYFWQKLEHVDRAKVAWILSEEFGLYEALRGGPATIAQVAHRIGLHHRPTEVLLAASACLGIVGVENGRYFLHQVMRDIVLDGGRSRAKPPQLDPSLDWWYRTMKKALSTNAMVPEAMPDWLTKPSGGAGVTAHVPERHGFRTLWGEWLAAAFDFTPFHLIADLGGATGGVLVGLTGACPHMKGVVVDLPYSRATAEAAIAQSGAADRVGFHAADFFRDPFPPGIDVFFMSHVIHDWDDQHCVQLLTRCCDALPMNAPVIVQEYRLDEDKSGSLLGVFQWFGLMYGTIGDQRTVSEIECLMEQAGLKDMDARPLDHEQAIVIGWKR